MSVATVPSDRHPSMGVLYKAEAFFVQEVRRGPNQPVCKPWDKANFIGRINAIQPITDTGRNFASVRPLRGKSLFARSPALRRSGRGGKTPEKGNLYPAKSGLTTSVGVSLRPEMCLVLMRVSAVLLKAAKFRLVCYSCCVHVM